MKRTLMVVLVLLVVAITPKISSADIILSGDGNITNPLIGSFGTSVDTGNQHFFINILRAGSRVVVLTSTPDAGSADLFDADINTFYNGM